MNVIEIVYTVAQIAVGNLYMWDAPGNLTFKVVGLHPAPDAAFAGNRIAPFADVIWSDDNGKVTTMNLQSIASGVRIGQIIPTD